ncbi:hypothetical protein Tco_0094746, partial [Tanacetum coccineum]
MNILPPEWSKFVTDVKLVRDLQTTNIDQLHAYLGQHEFHANEVRLMHERNSDLLALFATHQMTQSPYQTHENSYNMVSLKDVIVRSLKLPSQCKLQPKADIDFDELTAMASENSSSGPALHEMTLTTISSGLMPNPPPSTPFVQHSRTDWDMLFQPLFDKLLNPLPSVDHPAPEVVAPIDEVATPEPAVSTSSPSLTIVDQYAP